MQPIVCSAVNVKVQMHRYKRLRLNLNVAITFYEQTFAIGEVESEIVIPITYDIMPNKCLKDISEICFVIKPNYVKKLLGQIEIKELKFRDSLITNG